MYTPFKLDLMNNMEHVRISGTEPSSVILSRTKKFQKVESGGTQLWRYKPTKLQFQSILTQKILMPSSNALIKLDESFDEMTKYFVTTGIFAANKYKTVICVDQDFSPAGFFFFRKSTRINIFSGNNHIFQWQDRCVTTSP